MIGTAIGTLMLIGVIAIMVMRFYNQDIVPMKNNRMWMNTAAYVDYIPTQHTLVLKKRGPELSKAIKILDDRDYKISYKPEEYIFTSVTVGGITTGGVDKIGGYNYISGSTKTGKYQLWYIDKLVRNIRLSDELFEQAKESLIAEYLNMSTKEIVVISSVSLSYTTRMLLDTGHTDYAFDNITKESKAGYPTYEKCIKIMNWLCSNEETDRQQNYTERVVIGTKEAAQILGITQTDVQKLCRDGKLKTAVRGDKKAWQIDKQEVYEYKQLHNH